MARSFVAADPHAGHSLEVTGTHTQQLHGGFFQFANLPTDKLDPLVGDIDPSVRQKAISSLRLPMIKKKTATEKFHKELEKSWGLVRSLKGYFPSQHSFLEEKSIVAFTLYDIMMLLCFKGKQPCVGNMKELAGEQTARTSQSRKVDVCMLYCFVFI